MQVANATPLSRVNVTRVADNLYRDSLSGNYIQTQVCAEWAYNEEATLDDTALGARLYFNQTGRSCTVVRVFQDALPTREQQIEAAALATGWQPVPFAPPEALSASALSHLQALRDAVCKDYQNLPFGMRQYCLLALQALAQATAIGQ